MSIVKKVAEHSYLVKTDQGHLLRRNRRFLRSTGELPDVSPKAMTSSKASGAELQRTESHNEFQTTQKVQLPPEQTKEPVEMPPTVTNADQENLSAAESPAKSTRSGRVIKTPARFKDFAKL